MKTVPPAKLEKIVESFLVGADGSHDFDHTLRVVRNAVELCRKLPQADKEIVEAAALLHDICRPAEDAAMGKGPCHAAAGAVRAEEIILQEGGCKEFAGRVSAAIARHRFRSGNKPVTIEDAILYDADKLDSLGATGIGRAFLFAGKVGAKLHNSADKAVNSPAYSKEDTAWREYLVKLRHLPERMLTVPGREIAQERAAYMEDFFRRLQKETGIS